MTTDTVASEPPAQAPRAGGGEGARNWGPRIGIALPADRVTITSYCNYLYSQRPLRRQCFLQASADAEVEIAEPQLPANPTSLLHTVKKMVDMHMSTVKSRCRYCQARPVAFWGVCHRHLPLVHHIEYIVDNKGVELQIERYGRGLRTTVYTYSSTKELYSEVYWRPTNRNNTYEPIYAKAWVTSHKTNIFEYRPHANQPSALQVLALEHAAIAAILTNPKAWKTIAVELYEVPDTPYNIHVTKGGDET